MARRKARGSRRKGSCLGKLFFVLILLGALAAGAAWMEWMPYGPDTQTLVTIAPGSSTNAIGRKLQSAGIVRTRYAFEALRWIEHGKLHAGTYKFDRPATPVEVYTRIVRGDVYTKSLTIPEGANIFEVADKVEQAGLGARKDFLDAALTQTALIADLDPEAKSLEGYLFPDTYKISPTATPAQIAATMVHRFRQAATQLGLKGDVHRIVTMASLVERETAVPSERPMVASVFENRLAQRMPLATDPAVIYGLELEDHWRGAIYASDLTRDTPYNTYLHAGLPPGPVANPGMPALRAAMDPAKTNFLYFVAGSTDAQGHSLFAATLEEHNHNVAEYRSAQKKAGER